MNSLLVTSHELCSHSLHSNTRSGHPPSVSVSPGEWARSKIYYAREVGSLLNKCIAAAAAHGLSRVSRRFGGSFRSTWGSDISGLGRRLMESGFALSHTTLFFFFFLPLFVVSSLFIVSCLLCSKARALVVLLRATRSLLLASLDMVL